MVILFICTVLLVAVGAYGTMLSTRGDNEYRQAAKGNIARLSWIYAVVVTLSLAAVGLYIAF
ncbi:hypothetical protein QYG89_09620 [Bacillus sp. B190/17]|uniref:Uncharacterized protein n=1 Tax=Bacillus lumedeiriae TaxID=3058829 RepID=A0ABW8IB30_9BACI